VDKYTLRESAIVWLKERGFEEQEIEGLQHILNNIEMHKRKDDPVIIIPKTTSKRVAMMVHLVDSITDGDGNPVCFEKTGFIDIPEEAREYYENELELGELEDAVAKLQKVKFGRMHSSPKRRGSVLSERY